MGALEADHQPLVRGGNRVGCGVPLDRCRQPHEGGVERWDYVFVLRDSDDAVGVEVHHADANQVDVMIGKRDWAERLLGTECRDLSVVRWLWVASASGTILFTPQHYLARRLAEAGIEFPRRFVELP
jgi:hypothetical protein